MKETIYLSIMGILASITVITYFSQPKTDSCIVNRIVDADTIICNHQRIRFVSVYAAELNTREGVIAKQTLAKALPIGTRVNLIPSPDGRKTDKYHRRLDDITISDSRQNQLLQQALKEVNTK